MSKAAGAEATTLATSVSTYPLVAASLVFVGVVRLVIVLLVPASIFSVPLIVTSLNCEVPEVAVTFVFKEPLEVSDPFKVMLLKTDVPVEVILPATSPVTPPTNPLLAVI